MSENGGPKRTQKQRERDLAIVSELYLQGLPESEITKVISAQYDDFDLSERTIRNDKAELRRRWIESQIVNFDEAKARELEAIDRQIEACWIGWQNSLRDEGWVEEENREDEDLPGGDSSETIKTKHYKRRERRAKRDGSIVWQQEIRLLREQRIKILGLYEAEKFQMDWRSRLEKTGMPSTAIEKTLEDALDHVEKIFVQYENTDDIPDI